MLHLCPASCGGWQGPFSSKVLLVSYPKLPCHRPCAAACSGIADFCSQKEELWQGKSRLGRKLFSWLGSGGL